MGVELLQMNTRVHHNLFIAVKTVSAKHYVVSKQKMSRLYRKITISGHDMFLCKKMKSICLAAQLI